MLSISDPTRRAGPRPRWLSLPLVLLALGCAPAPPPAADPPPVFVLVTLDTLRRDHVGVYRPQQESHTPNLDELASSSVVFEEAFVTIPFTLSSHMSMFTGLYPDVHRIERKDVRLSAEARTLPEIFQANGYRTLGLVSIEWLDPKFGFGRGFDHYERIGYDLTYSKRLNRRLFQLLDRSPQDRRPLFLFLHFIDPHSDFFNVGHNLLPYYAEPDYLARIGVGPESREFCTAADECATDFLMAADRGQVPLSESTLERIEALYRGGVEYLDRDLGELFAGLKERGLWERATVVVTTDHGEEFREHGEFLHRQPFVENMASPLMIRLPGSEHGGTRRRGLADSVDLLPTLLDLAGFETPSYVQGRSLLPLLESGRPIRSWTLGRDKLRSRRYSLRTPDHSLIHDFDSGETQLFDRRTDPEELVDLSRSEPERVAELMESLASVLRGNRGIGGRFRPDRVQGGLLDEEQSRKLRALGYLD